MNWEAIGAIAEILGSLAVIVTLVLLILQLKTNSIMIQNSTAQSSTSSISEWARQLTQNPDLYSGLEKVRWEAELVTFGVNYNTPGGRASWERQKYMLDPRFQKEVEQYFSQ